jgi:hypothetical protein
VVWRHVSWHGDTFYGTKTGFIILRNVLRHGDRFHDSQRGFIERRLAFLLVL